MGKTAVLFVNLNKKNSKDTSIAIKKELERRQIDVTVFSFDKKPESPPEGNWDIAFSLGGDGTVLYAARCLAPMGIPILPVNLGALGFIAGVDADNWLSVFNMWEKNDISLSRRSMLEIYASRDSRVVYKNICLNDIVVSAGGIAKLINLDVFINEDANRASVSEKTFGSYRCDGLIVSTPTGSTAYSMAAGGPILDPEMEAMILNPICPFSLSNRSFVLPSRLTLSINIANEQRTGILLTVDGQDTFNLERSDKIFIRQAEKPALLIYSGKDAYYSALRTKLFHIGANGKSGETDA